MNKTNLHNLLGNEKSPYLLQHKDNPVNWHAWGPEAFAKAKSENKLVFLSIGYSTCYWCHVMEKDSFEKDDVAEVLNKYYVAIKVDREEMPEIDAIYMEAVQGMTGQGGWPLSAFLTPDLKPFFGGTFFWRAQFLQILRRAQDEWVNAPQGILEHGERIRQALQEAGTDTAAATGKPDAKIFDATLDALKRGFDSKQGGFGRAPKFPHSMDLDLLLYRYHATHDETLLKMVVQTLDAMARGGIYDQLGGGFHRYSTDDSWFAPHFEKMLYDNALLVNTYLDAHCVTGEKRFADVARETLDYVLREMTHPDGGFYSAQDAGEVDREGEFYVWTHAELEQVLTTDELAHMEILGVTQAGNWEHGKNILHMAEGQDWESRGHPIMHSARKKLFHARQKRPAPHLDTKILVSWNGLMIAAFAKGHRVLGEERYLRAAQKAASFLRRELDVDGNLKRRFCAGEARFAANLDDFAFLISGLLGLYQSDFDEAWVSWALDLQRRQNAGFWDQDAGAYCFAAADDALIVRQKTFYDGVIPSGNAVSLANLVTLEHLCLTGDFLKHVEQLTKTLLTQSGRMLMGCARGLMSLGALADGTREVVALGNPESADIKMACGNFFKSYLPNCIFILGGELADVAQKSPVAILKGKTVQIGKAAFYICEGGSCHAPETDVSVVLQKFKS